MTILQAELDNLESTDKAYHPLYTQRDGKYVLTGVVGYTPEDRVKVNNALKRERDAASAAVNALKPWQTLFGDKKPEDVQAIVDSVEELKLAAKGKLDESAIEERVTARLEAKTKPFQRKVAEAEEKAAKAEARVKAFEQAEERSAIRAAIQREALASGALPESYGEGGGLLAVLESQLKVEVETVTDESGNPVRKLGKVVSRDGATELPKLLQQIQATQGYFWGPSKGGGSSARGGNGNGGTVVKGNPWKKESRNLTEQMRITRENPQLAERYKAEAGAS